MGIYRGSSASVSSFSHHSTSVRSLGGGAMAHLSKLSPHKETAANTQWLETMKDQHNKKMENNEDSFYASSTSIITMSFMMLILSVFVTYCSQKLLELII